MTMQNVKVNIESVELFLKKLQEQGALVGVPKKGTLNQTLEWINENWGTEIGILGDGWVERQKYDELEKDLQGTQIKLIEETEERERIEDLHKRWKENHPALLREAVEVHKKEAAKTTAEARVKVAEINGASTILSAAMSAAAKEKKFIDTFGEEVKGLIPTLFTEKEKPAIGGKTEGATE